MSTGVWGTLESLYLKLREKWPQRFEDSQVRLSRFVAADCNGILLADKLLSSVGVIEYNKTGLGQLGMAIEDRAVCRDSNGFGALDVRLIRRTPVTVTADQ